MSWNPALDPDCPKGDAVDAIETVIIPRSRDLGGFEVRRALPAPKRQMVGPFIFFDQMGPAEFVTGTGIDVRPHPHIGLATVTYLYKGKIHHRDSVGTDQWIEPGAVNWMVAGQGITHSERVDGKVRQNPHSLFGIQTWVALPKDAEDDPAAFEHAPKEALPFLEAAREVGVGLSLFVAPTTDDARLMAVLDADPAFIYAVAEVGVTGERDTASANIETLERRIRSHSEVPIVFGVGISTPEHASAAARHGDGVIVGTAIVRKVLEARSAEAAAVELSKFVANLSAAIR